MEDKKMSKSVLVIDSPEDCTRCPMLNSVDECILQDEAANVNADTLDELIQTCPLKPLPEKMKLTGKYNQEYFQKGGKTPSYKVGWNACIDEITGDE